MSTTSPHQMASDAIPVLDDDPYSPENLEDPHPFQERLREAGPVAYLSTYGVYALGRYDEIYQALSDWQCLISGAGVGLNPPWRAKGLLQTDPPDHDARREVLADILSARKLRSMKERCHQKATSLIDELLGRGARQGTIEIDGHRDIGSAFPVDFFPEASGIPEEQRQNLIPYADHIFNAHGPKNEPFRETVARGEALEEWALGQCQRDKLKPEGFGAEIWAAADRGDLLYEQAALLTRSLLSAGVDTTVYGLSAMLYGLATHPEQWAALRTNPNLARVAFDEALRWESPVQTLFRQSSKPVEFSGVVIPAGARVLISYGAANRDPRRWKNPTMFDLSRDPSGHLAFGFGIHQCVGQHAARLQAECLLEVLVSRVATMEIAGPVKRHHNNALRGWEAIPLRLTLDAD